MVVQKYLKRILHQPKIKNMKNKALLFLFPSILFSCTIYITWTYGFHFPFWDQWNFVTHLDMFLDGKMTLQTLFSQHNEHRLFFPRIIMLTMAYFTNWNISYEIGLNLILGFLIFYFVVEQLHITFDLKKNPYRFFIAFAMSFVYLSMSHFENWTWGWQIQIFLNVLMVFLGLFWLNKSEGKLKYFVLAILAGMVATFSFANGMAFWVIGFLFILSFQEISFKQKIQYLGIWVVIFLGIFGLYIWGYYTPAGLNNRSFTLGFLIKYISFVFGYFGMMMHSPNEKWFVGLTIIIIYVIATIYLFIKEILFTKKFRIYWFLSMYSIMSALITGLNRADFGNGSVGVYNVASRYMLIVSFLWVFIFVFLFYILQKHTFKKHYIIYSFIVILLTLFSFFLFEAHKYGIRETKGRYMATEKASKEILKSAPDTTIIKAIYGHNPTLIDGIKTLKKRKFSIYEKK